MLGFVLGIFMVVGAITTLCVIVAVGYYIATRRPTPDMRIVDALKEIRWSYALAFFIAPCTLAGFTEGEPILGFAVGMFMPIFMVLMVWWSGPL